MVRWPGANAGAAHAGKTHLYPVIVVKGGSCAAVHHEREPHAMWKPSKADASCLCVPVPAGGCQERTPRGRRDGAFSAPNSSGADASAAHHVAEKQSKGSFPGSVPVRGVTGPSAGGVPVHMMPMSAELPIW